ncbi:MAG: hypothetical protein JXR56_06525, partial [Candidatus Cloacimonetes bacterium]|nr:hypothetical protein [Candidatus Cloacimonadota bacterium]
MKQVVFFLLLVFMATGIFADGTNTSTGAPMVMILPYTDTGDMIDNTNDNGQRGRDEWWEISPTINLTNLNIHVDFNSWDGYLYVYDSNMTQIAFDDDGPGGIYTSEVIINVNAGSTIYVCVDEYSASTGTRQFTLNISADQSGPISDPDAPMPANNPFPANNAMNVPLDATLTWDFGIQTETYDLYFDTVNPPVNQVVTGGTANGTGSYTPTGMQTATFYYWKVVSHNSVTTTTTPANFFFQTELGTNLIQIGNGTAVNQHLPIEPNYGYTYSQSIYLQSEIDMQAQRIEKVYYHYNGSGTLANSTQWIIYMGHTTANTFSSTTSWVPITSLTTVYDGALNAPTGAGWIEIILQTPFVYNNVDNLVIAVEENATGIGLAAEDFFCQDMAASRSLYYYNSSTNPNPASPPTGTLSNYIPETRLYFDALPTLPELSFTPASWNFGTLYCNTASNPVDCSAQNTGTGTLNIQSIVIDDDVNFTLVDNNNYPLALNSAQSMNFDVIFNPIDDGPLTGIVTITDDLRQTYTMTFNGIGFNATIDNFPYVQNFENAGAIPIGWEQGLDDQQNWSFGTSTSSVSTGPQAGDHTTGTGYFAFTEASGYLNMRFDLLAPPVDVSSLTNPFCTVWYNMYGQSMGSLHFDIWDGTQWVEDFAPAISGDQGQEWHMLDFAISGYGDVVQVRFRGVTGSNFYSDISIDDVAFWDNGDVPGPTTLVAPLDGETGVPMTGSVSWDATPGAGGYYVNIGTDNPPSNIYNMADAGATLSFDYSGLTAGVVHYLQVIPYNAVGNAVNCPIWSFTTFNQVPNAATIVSPPIGATYQNVFPTLSWASGGNFPDGYKLNLGTDNPPTDVYNNEDLGFVTSYVVPTELNPLTVYYWQIIPYNFVGDATNCPIWNFTTAPEGLVVVGTGNVEGQPLPIEPYYGYSYSQTIYLQSELNIQGQRIESILYYYDGAGTLNNEYEWVIYMGHTTETQFASTTSWLPISQFTEVFNATIAPPTGAGWIEFALDTP